jgi:hypothetical protein
VQALQVDAGLGMGNDEEEPALFVLEEEVLECPPGISSLIACDSATVNTGTWS